MKKMFGIISLALLIPAYSFAADEKPPVKISGYAQVQYIQSENYSNADGDRFGMDTFKVRRARLRASGMLSEPVSYAVELDGRATPSLIQAFIVLKFLPRTNLTVGQFKVPFSHEALLSSKDIMSIERAAVVTAAKVEEDIGLEFSGNYDYLKYGVGIYNGRGLNVDDDNDQKNLVGRIVVTPLKGLDLGLSYYAGKADMESVDGMERIDYNRSGVQAVWNSELFNVAAEYIAGDGIYSGAAVADNEFNGWYIQALYRLMPYFHPVIKFDTYDPNTDEDEDEDVSDNIFVGFVSSFGNGARFQAGYVIRDEEGDSIDNNQLLTQLQVVY